MDLIKPSMMSVAESANAHEDDGGAAAIGDKKSVFGLSAFRAT